ncbi:adipocyte enhancer-binding protein 1-like [Anneissia japonica]|uniref:adipocyte enhancer-binding protein 1-like n=1 Tax=Anneissia japonica TaxID=1529436 RepID=UPI00142565D0|nr:adipocyte enhancer-binding protein 1-like [Anneissia japonica]
MQLIWLSCLVFLWSSVAGEQDLMCDPDGCCTEEKLGCGDCDEVINEFGQVHCECWTCQPGICHDYLVKNGNDNMFSSSSNTFGMEAENARLVTEENSPDEWLYFFGWQPEENDTSPWLQVDLTKKHHISGIETRGNPFGDEFVSAYKVMVSMDNTHWRSVGGPEYDDGLFVGNSDGNSSTTNYFDSPVFVRSLRVYPLAWESQIVLRLDLLGCLTMPTITTTKEPTDVNNINISVYLIGGICFTLLLALIMVVCLINTPRRRKVIINQDSPNSFVATPPGSIASSPTSASSGDTSFPNPAFATSQKSLLPNEGSRQRCESNPYIQVSFLKNNENPAMKKCLQQTEIR